MAAAFDSRFPSIDDLRTRAKQRIPKFAFEYLDGGCNEEVNLRKNTEDLQQIELVPRYLRDHQPPHLETTLFGHTYSAPFGVAPIGLQGLIWPGAPELLAKAAMTHNLPFILSTVSTASIERIAQITEGKAWFQLYNPAEDTLREDLLSRAEQAGIEVLVLLSDVPSFGYRHKDIRNGLSMPPKMTLRNLLQILNHPQWALSTLAKGQPEFQTLKPYMPKNLSLSQLGAFMNQTFSGKLTEEKIAPIRDRWKGKLVLKGVASAEDAAIAAKLGFDGLIVSNHGGRQIDAGESSIRSLDRVLSAVDPKQLTVMLDSGLRSGPDIARALARGASFTFMGRPFMYGVAALGAKGPDHTIELLRRQLQQVLEQLCCERPEELHEFLAQ
ncbi:MAG: alpha-hydroxy acid oxidase [Flavobacteriaceae bacterium]